MSKKRKQLKAAGAPIVTIDASRGTPLWAYNHYRKSILTHLLNDLIELENDGLDEDYCKKVRASLGHFVNAATDVPSGGFLTGSLYREAQAFEKLYKEWNDVNGREESHIKKRRELLVQLRGKRQRITDKVRNLQVEMFNSLDTVVLVSTYKALGDLIESVPGMFKNLASAYADYIKRGPLPG